MEKVIWSRCARQSIRIIWKFYVVKNPDAAQRIIDGIIKTAENILYAEQFQREELIGSDYRRAIYKHFKIIYSKSEKHIRILQVFDTRQDPSRMNH